MAVAVGVSKIQCFPYAVFFQLKIKIYNEIGYLGTKYFAKKYFNFQNILKYARVQAPNVR